MIKYFQVEVNENYTAPQPIGWYGKIDRKSLQGKKAYQMPKHLLFKVEQHMQMVFTDIIMFPCFMASGMVRGVIEQYASDVSFARAILFDKEKRKSMAYYIPFLERIEPAEGEAVEHEHKELKKIFVDEGRLGNRVIAETADGDKACVIMRMDLVESILRRGAVGIGIKEVEVVRGFGGGGR